jgi:signal transduction histidine kinase
MRQSNLLRSTPFRLALAFSLLFVLAFVVAGLVAFQVLRADLSERLDASVKDTFAVVAATYSGADLEDLVATVDSHAKLARDEDRFLSLVGASGTKLAGSFLAPALPAGYATASGPALGIPNDDSYRVYSGKVGDNTLSVAVSFAETEELVSLMVASFGWATIIVLGLAVIGGALLATRVQRRLDLIAATMVEVSHGRLDTRIPLIGRGDDIDQVSSQVNAALERLSGLVASMKQVSENIAHDLKTPLGRLQINLEEAVSSATAGKDLTSNLAEALNECGRINGTFEALLRIAQIEAGARKASFKLVDLAEVIATIAEIYTDVADDDGKKLVAMVSPKTLSLINGDHELLIQMFANLVENAIRHCPVETKISLSTDATTGRVLAIVSDSGPGIPPDKREKVFQRLYRLDDSRSTRGSGLGLSLVRAIADLHDASIELQDNDPGLKVVVEFPSINPNP